MGARGYAAPYGCEATLSIDKLRTGEATVEQAEAKIALSKPVPAANRLGRSVFALGAWMWAYR